MFQPQSHLGFLIVLWGRGSGRGDLVFSDFLSSHGPICPAIGKHACVHFPLGPLFHYPWVMLECCNNTYAEYTLIFMCIDDLLARCRFMFVFSSYHLQCRWVYFYLLFKCYISWNIALLICVLCRTGQKLCIYAYAYLVWFIVQC
jgi:hypothetical protein